MTEWSESKKQTFVLPKCFLIKVAKIIICFHPFFRFCFIQQVFGLDFGIFRFVPVFLQYIQNFLHLIAFDDAQTFHARINDNTRQ